MEDAYLPITEEKSDEVKRQEVKEFHDALSENLEIPLVGNSLHPTAKSEEIDDLELIGILIEEEEQETFTTAKRARSLSPERTEHFHVADPADKVIFAERFPKAKSELDVKLKGFISRVRKAGEGMKLLVVANEILMASSFNDLSTTIFKVSVEKFKILLKTLFRIIL